MKVRVAVVGSVNLDIVVHTSKRPKAGETLLGSGYSETLGGKGANQVIASARIMSTAFVGDVGQDAAGSKILQGLAGASVDLAQLRRSELPTGRAVILVTPDGENSITVLPMANGAIDPSRVRGALTVLQPDVVLAQLEVSAAVVTAAAEWTVDNGRRFVFNLSPVEVVDLAVVAVADPLIVNANEAGAILGGRVEDDLGALAVQLGTFARSVVLTTGRDGAWVFEGEKVVQVAGIAVEVVDTTGAGDAFAGTLAARLALGESLVEAATAANAEAARTVQLDRSDR